MAEGSEPTGSSSAELGADATRRVHQLRVVLSPAAPPVRLYNLERHAVTIGRDPGGERALRLEDPMASRVHAAVEPEGDGWVVVDRGSRHRLHVDGAPVERAALRPGAVLRIGHSLLVFVAAEVPPGARLEPESSELRGSSIAMQRVRGEIALLAERPFAVLIVGETGTGKERVAREIHRRSGRAGAFVAASCVALADPPRLFAEAAGGTLFLDEVADLPAAQQPLLLQALAHAGDARVVSSTQRDLRRLAADGGFRLDLYARLAGWTLRVPPLRERREDIVRLAAAALEAQGAPPLSVRAAEALLLHDWPCNARELEQTLAAAAMRAAGDSLIRTGHLPPEIAGTLPAEAAPAAPPPLELAVSRDEVPSGPELRLVLERFAGNVAQVAKYFGRERPQIYRWAARHGIDIEAYRRES